MTFELTQQQQNLWADRYALRDQNGEVIENGIEDTWRRVASAIGDNDDERDSFQRLLEGFKFVPGGRILAGAGAETEKTFYNCYVIPVEARRERDVPSKAGSDSREAIFDTIKTMVDIMSRGGGVGINWSVLRPSGSYLTRISGTSSGPVGWMDVASAAVGEVTQGGSRRGAAMFMLDDWHPDVLNFIDAKRKSGKITNANISVSISDEFMEAVKRDAFWTLRFPDTTDPDYNSSWDGDLTGWENRGGRVIDHERVRAKELWRAIAEAAHASGEPGVVFLGRYNKQSTAGDIERIISVNPCGEQGLGAYSVCNLGAMNLDAYFTYTVHKGASVGISTMLRPAQKGFNWEAFENDVRTAIRFLDNVIDKTFYFLRQTEDQQKKLRRIGLGVMGLADVLVRLGIRYGSPESVEFTERVFRTMKDAAIETSNSLAREKGSAHGWDDLMWRKPYLQEYLQRNLSSHEIDTRWGMRNLFLLTQAPTGTTSLLAGVNSGIEPYFSLKTWRQDRTGGRYVYAKAVQETHPEYLNEASAIDPSIVTSNEVTVEGHLAVQSGSQKWIDSSVSKTINAPKGQSVEEAEKAFTLAYDQGNKGIAYYRDGSRDVQVLYAVSPNERIAELEEKVEQLKAKLEFKSKSEYYSQGSVIPEPFKELIAESALRSPSSYRSIAGVGGPSSCPACENGEIVFEEGCQKCYSCGWSAC